jgi:hypothetical protein
MGVSLYLIEGDRVVPRSLREAVVKLDHRFLDEDSRRQLLIGELEFSGKWSKGDDVWLWVDEETGRELGYASFPLIPGRGRVLQRVWIEPAYRRQHLLTDTWDVWCERYGDDFPIDEPNAAMLAFLSRRGAGPAS